MKKNICIIMAMKSEAEPFLTQLKNFEKVNHNYHESLEIYKGFLEEKTVHVLIAGKSPSFNVDCIGTLPAALSTFIALRDFNPDLIINAGTAGGFSSRGAKIGDVYFVTSTSFHDRRVPLPGFQEYGVHHANINFDNKALIQDLGLKTGHLSTGDSLDMSLEDKKIIEDNQSNLKDMEGAAISWVAQTYKVPIYLLKSVTDIVDSERVTQEEFLENLDMASRNLSEKLVLFIRKLTNF